MFVYILVATFSKNRSNTVNVSSIFFKKKTSFCHLEQNNGTASNKSSSSCVCMCGCHSTIAVITLRTILVPNTHTHTKKTAIQKHSLKIYFDTRTFVSVCTVCEAFLHEYCMCHVRHVHPTKPAKRTSSRAALSLSLCPLPLFLSCPHSPNS